MYQIVCKNKLFLIGKPREILKYLKLKKEECETIKEFIDLYFCREK
jgi:hypothetical protein